MPWLLSFRFTMSLHLAIISLSTTSVSNLKDYDHFTNSKLMAKVIRKIQWRPEMNPPSTLALNTY